MCDFSFATTDGCPTSLDQQLCGWRLPFANPFTDRTLMTQRTVEPLGHLHLPVGHTRQLVPAAGSMHPARDTNDFARYSNLAQRRIQIGRFAERDVLILIAKDLQERRIAF